MITLRKSHVWNIVGIMSILLMTSCEQDDELSTVNIQNRTITL